METCPRWFMYSRHERLLHGVRQMNNKPLITCLRKKEEKLRKKRVSSMKLYVDDIIRYLSFYQSWNI